MSEKTSRSPWPIAITSFFVIAIIFIAAFIAFALCQREDLVSADYYEREVHYQSQLDSMNRSQTVAAKTVVTFERARQVIIIHLPEAQAPGATGSIHLYRPSDARLDREWPLAINADGVQQLDARELSSGLWKVRVKWTSSGEDFFLDQVVVIPRSQS